MGWLDPVVSVRRSVYHRLNLMVEELNHRSNKDWNTDDLVSAILSDFCTQYFDHSIRAGVDLMKENAVREDEYIFKNSRLIR